MPTHVELGTVWIDVSVSESHSLSAEVSEHPVESGTDVTDNIRPTPRTIRVEGLVTNYPIEEPLSHIGTARASRAGYQINAAPNTLPRVPPNSIEIEGEPTTYGLNRAPGFGQALALASGITGALGLPRQLPRRKYAAEQNNLDRSASRGWQVSALTFTEDFDRVRAVYDALCQIVDAAQPVQLVTGLEVYDTVALSDLSFERSGDIGRNTLKFSASCKVMRTVAAQSVPVPAEQRGKPGVSRGKQTTTVTPPATLSDAAKAQLRASLIEKAKLLGPDAFAGLLGSIGFGGGGG
jgi:hypothetical protein